MSAEAVLASGVRRILAVFIDWLVFFGIWTVVGIFLQGNSLFVALGLFVLLDVLLTAFIGQSVGRFATGIRIVRTEGSSPGLVSALVRTALVLVTGWVGFFVYSLRAYNGAPTPRMWWDAAAGTQLVLTRPREAATPPGLPKKPPGDPVRHWRELDSRALAFHKAAKQHTASDPNLSQAETFYKEALEVARSSGQPLLLATAYNNLAGLYIDQDRINDAIPCFESALELRRSNAGLNNDMTIKSFNRLSEAYADVERWADAERLQRQLLDFYRESDPKGEAVVEALTGIGVMCRHQRKYAEAERCYSEASEMLKARGQGESPLAGRLLNDWAYLKVEQGRYDEAEPMYRQAISIQERGRDDWKTASWLDNLADLYTRQARYAEAADASRRQVALVEKVVKVRTGRTDSVAILALLEQHVRRLEAAGLAVEAEPFRTRAAAIRARADPAELRQLETMR